MLHVTPARLMIKSYAFIQPEMKNDARTTCCNAAMQCCNAAPVVPPAACTHHRLQFCSAAQGMLPGINYMWVHREGLATAQLHLKTYFLRVDGC